MALPSIEKTWQYNINNIVAGADQTTINKTLVLNWKNALKAFATNPWTVRYSCDSVTAGRGPISGTGDSFSQSGSTTTLTDAGGAFVSGMVGSNITITGATTPANNGTFPITNYISATQIEYTNASGVTEAFAGSYTVAPDLTDRLSTISNLVYNAAGSAHSWIVLRNVSGVEFLIECRGTGGGVAANISLYISPAATFTGGTTLNRPTATDEVVPISSGSDYQMFPTSSAVPMRWHMMMSTDAEVTRIFLCNSGFVTGYIEVGKAKMPVAGWTTPWYISVSGTGGLSNRTTYTQLFTTPGLIGWRNNATVAAGGYSTEGVAGTALGATVTLADDYGGNFIITPIGLASNTAGARGRPGQVYDMWWGSSLSTNGDLYPEAPASRTLVVLGNLMVTAGGYIWLMG